jgi:signal transduction histidine kinase
MVDDVTMKVSGQPEVIQELKEVRSAVNAVARRSDGLMNFVTSYQQLTRLPAPEKTFFRVADLFSEVTKMSTVGWLEKNLALLANVEPNELDLHADRQMIEQVLINLLQNCEHALHGAAQGRVTLSARLNRHGNVTIEVSDNGPGIPAEIASKIFVPFFTTRSDGSGVGLALSRQVMIAHGGTISFTNVEQGGARFALVF